MCARSGSTHEATLETAQQLIQSMESLDAQEVSNGRDLFLKLYNLINEMMNRFPEKYSTDKNMAKQKLKALLLAMRNGSSEGLQLFPSALSLLLKNPEFQEMFQAWVNFLFFIKVGFFN